MNRITAAIAFRVVTEIERALKEAPEFCVNVPVPARVRLQYCRRISHGRPVTVSALVAKGIRSK